MSQKNEKRYRKTVRQLAKDGSVGLAEYMRRGKLRARRRHLIRALAGGDPEKLVYQRKEKYGPRVLFLKQQE